MSGGLAVEFEVTIAVVTPLSMMTSATHDKAVALITVARETAERVLAGDSGGSALPIRIAAQRVVELQREVVRCGERLKAEGRGVGGAADLAFAVESFNAAMSVLSDLLEKETADGQGQDVRR